MDALGGYVKFLGDENAASAPDVDAIEKMDAQTRKTTLTNLWAARRRGCRRAGREFILAIIIFAGFTPYWANVSPTLLSARWLPTARQRRFPAGDLIN